MGIYRVLGPEYLPHKDEGAKDPDTGEVKDKFVRGEFVESPFDLDRMFEGSFERMDGKLAKTHRDRDHMLDRGGTTQVMDLPRATKAKMVKTAEARKARGEDEGDEPAQRLQFNRDPRKRNAPPVASTVRDEDLVDEEDENYPASRLQDEEDEDNSDVGVQEESEFGDDVTTEFPGAKSGKFKVFKDEDDKYTVVKRGKEDESLHDDPFGSEEEVETFMEEEMDRQKKATEKKTPKKGGKKRK